MLSPIVVVNSETQRLCELSTQMVFGVNTGFGANTGFGMYTVCELFPHIHTEGFHCVCQGLFLHLQFLPQIRVQCVSLARCEFAVISSRIRIVFCVSRPLIVFGLGMAEKLQMFCAVYGQLVSKSTCVFRLTVLISISFMACL